MSTILVVDDLRGFREVLREFLVEKGYEVREARDGIEALAVLEEAQIDIVIADVFMPRMDGIELLSRLRTKPERPTIVAVSGAGEAMGADNPLDLARGMGADITLEKPFDFDTLTTQIEAHVARSRVADAA